MVTCREDGSSWHHCSSPHFITLFFCCSPLERITWLFLYPFHIHTPSPVSPLFCFFNPPSSFCTHYGLTVSIATLFFFIWHTWLPCWLWSLDLSIKGPFTHLPGEVTEMSVFSFCGVREAGWKNGVRCNKWRVRDDRACDPVFHPLRFWAGFCVWSFCHMRHESNFFASLLLSACL